MVAQRFTHEENYLSRHRFIDVGEHRLELGYEETQRADHDERSHHNEHGGIHERAEHLAERVADGRADHSAALRREEAARRPSVIQGSGVPAVGVGSTKYEARSSKTQSATRVSNTKEVRMKKQYDVPRSRAK